MAGWAAFAKIAAKYAGRAWPVVAPILQRWWSSHSKTDDPLQLIPSKSRRIRIKLEAVREQMRDVAADDTHSAGQHEAARRLVADARAGLVRLELARHLTRESRKQELRELATLAQALLVEVRDMLAPGNDLHDPASAVDAAQATGRLGVAMHASDEATAIVDSAPASSKVN